MYFAAFLLELIAIATVQAAVERKISHASFQTKSTIWCMLYSALERLRNDFVEANDVKSNEVDPKLPQNLRIHYCSASEEKKTVCTESKHLLTSKREKQTTNFNGNHENNNNTYN